MKILVNIDHLQNITDGRKLDKLTNEDEHTKSAQGGK